MIEKDDVMVMMMMKLMIFVVYQSKGNHTLVGHHLDTKPYFLKSLKRTLTFSRTVPPVLCTETSDLSLPAARRSSTNSGAFAVPSQLLRRPRAVLDCGVKRVTVR